MRIRKAVVADAAAIARVHVDSWRTTYRGTFPDAYLAALSYERGEAHWTSWIRDGGEDRFVLVAEDPAGSIVGFVSGGPATADGATCHQGEVYAIYLLAEHQRRGMGTLLMRAAAELQARGMESLLVWVLAGNPAQHFYQALGGREHRRKATERGAVPVEEIAYHWPDLAPLTGLTADG